MIRRGTLSPLALPSVVALTRVNMFVPDGCDPRGRRERPGAGSAQSDDCGPAAAAALALAIVFLLPSGGSSLAIAAVGMASAGLAAYSAVQEWDKYTKQKTLYNTDLDVARSLSTKEPSLAGFAMSLVTLGLEGIPLIGAFNKARRLKALVDAGSETTDVARATVRELNEVGRRAARPTSASARSPRRARSASRAEARLRPRPSSGTAADAEAGGARSACEGAAKYSSARSCPTTSRRGCRTSRTAWSRRRCRRNGRC